MSIMIDKTTQKFPFQPLPLDKVEVKLDLRSSELHTGVLVLADDISSGSEYLGLVLFKTRIWYPWENNKLFCCRIN